jgi:MFS superfamily sulfate permease-like transporter
VLAGATLAALALPLNIGYATAAGLPPSVGIYSTLVPVVVFALTTGSRHLVVGPDATIAALLGVAAMPLVAAGHDAEEVAWAAALLIGLLLLACWLLRLGRIVRYLSRAVLTGFIAGLAIEVLTSQVRKIMAVEVDADGWAREVVELVRAVPDASVASVAVGLATIAIARGCRRIAPALPAALVALTIVTTAVAVLDPSGVSLLGEVPSTLPRPTFPTVGFEVWAELFPVALAIAALTIAEGVLLAQSSARRHDESLDANGEILSLGVTNAAAACAGGMPIGASASRTAAIEATGARTQLPAVTAAVLVAIVVVFLGDVVAALPNAALAGLVASAVVSTIDVAELRRFARWRRTEWWIAVGCGAGVLVFGPLGGIVLAVIASAFDVVRRAANAPWTMLTDSVVDPATDRFTAAGARPGPPAGLRIVRPGGPLFFANAEDLGRLFETAAADGTAWLVLDLETVGDIDPTAALALREGIELADSRDVVVAFTRVGEPVRGLLERYGVRSGDHGPLVYESNRDVERAYLQASDA